MVTNHFHCRCCQEVAKSEIMYQVKGIGRVYRYLLCPTCNSITNIDSSENVNYDDFMSAATTQQYIEIGAGIEFMIELLDPVINLNYNVNTKSYLQLGCGFGFLTRYAQQSGFGVCIGVEDANYGKRGSQILGFNCESLQEYVSNSQKFDVILASEVIEHVESPIEFLIEIKSRLLVDGILVLTTPNSDFIEYEKIEAQDPLTIAALSPGAHTCLFSTFALQELLKKVGFKNVRMIVRHERLVVYASDNFDHNFTPSTSREIKQRYLGFLESLASSEDKDVRVGANLRIFKEFVNQGVVNEKVDDAYQALIQDFGGPILQFGNIENQTVMEIATLEDYQNHFRFYEGVFLFYAAQYERNLGKPGVQLALLERAISVIDRELSYFPDKFTESSSIRDVALERLDEALGFMKVRYFNRVAPPLIKRIRDSFRSKSNL